MSELEALRDAVARVRAIHREEDYECVECSFESMPDVGFRGVSVPWPCPTVAALDGEPEPEPEPEEEMYQARCGSWDCRAPECGRA